MANPTSRQVLIQGRCPPQKSNPNIVKLWSARTFTSSRQLRPLLLQVKALWLAPRFR